MRTVSTTRLSSRVARTATLASALGLAMLLAPNVAQAEDATPAAATPAAEPPAPAATGTTPTAATAESPAAEAPATAAPVTDSSAAPAGALEAPAGPAPAGAETAATPAPGPATRAWTGAATLGVASLPRVLSLEALVLKRRESDPRFFHYGFGAGIEYLPKGLAAFGPKTDFSWLQFGVDGRFFPWRWAFVGARLGWQFARADSEKFGSEVDYNTTSFFLAPKVGVLHTFANHITIGADFGATIPIGATTTLESDGTEDSGARKASKTFGAFVMPFVSLFRIGYTL